MIMSSTFFEIIYLVHDTPHVPIHLGCKHNFLFIIQKLQIFKTVILGEIDLAENAYETICFAIPLLDNEYISPDVMSKLRQV